jgi:hypothetical protein
MRGQEGVAVDLEGMEALGPSQDTEDDVVEEHAGDQQGAPLEGALGDFDEASGIRDEPWHSHAMNDGFSVRDHALCGEMARHTAETANAQRLGWYRVSTE